MKQYTLDDKFTFGKYRGQVIREIMTKDPGYISWCKANVKDFCIAPTTDNPVSSFDVDADFYSEGVEVLHSIPWKKRLLSHICRCAENVIVDNAISRTPLSQPVQLEIAFK